MISRLLIANRGEIACRIIRSCRRLGITTIAVFSAADRRALHVRLADESVHIGSAPAADSYLNIQALLAAANASRADAIHPGYGFLSENAGFARECKKGGLIFVGPDADTIASMGNKDVAKTIMEKAGVPVVPGYHGELQTDRGLQKEARRIGWPVMIKPCAGGGGKGMRIVREESAFAEALHAARREALSSFGDDRVLLEKFLENPRHVEVQVFADTHGNIVHLFERECSIQRRYQKIIEEAPCPSVADDMRREMTAAAITAARAVGYQNAGTVEFILDRDGRFFFMEMNTRLQVEHPVTEMITGLDLVEWQLRVASGEELPLTQEQITCDGHAIEARIYAENPYRDFLPATGTVEAFVHPPQENGLRVDSGITDGDRIGIHYDPLQAKLIVHDKSRRAATKKLQASLERTALFGVSNNLPLLRGIAASKIFAGAGMDTGYLDKHLDDVLPGQATPREILAIAAVVSLEHRNNAARIASLRGGQDAGSPWYKPDAWRLGGTAGSLIRFHDAHGPGAGIRVLPADSADSHYCHFADDRLALSVTECIEAVEPGPDWRESVWQVDGQEIAAAIICRGPWLQLCADGQCHELRRLNPYLSETESADEDAHPGSPLPGKIVALLVAEGDRVETGDKLLVLEGMKMEYTLLARTAGTIEKILYREGDIVEAEVALIDIQADEATVE
ncbi:MAG: acetyl-CoA carboxylase biotin carboxylase subunit [Gammaproteobacteria bacterium]|nr:MAG: acetyl-CoA carboxylase biotin carboxylase subunit [Gammaproteobacteria bacterium]